MEEAALNLIVSRHNHWWTERAVRLLVMRRIRSVAVVQHHDIKPAILVHVDDLGIRRIVVGLDKGGTAKCVVRLLHKDGDTRAWCVGRKGRDNICEAVARDIAHRHAADKAKRYADRLR